MADRRQQSQLRKEEKQRNDSARKADRQASRKAYLEEVKTIVGPDQYVLFLENMYVNQPGHGHDKAVKQSKRHGDHNSMTQGQRSKDAKSKDIRHHASGRHDKKSVDSRRS